MNKEEIKVVWDADRERNIYPELEKLDTERNNTQKVSKGSDSSMSLKADIQRQIPNSGDRELICKPETLPSEEFNLKEKIARIDFKYRYFEWAIEFQCKCGETLSIDDNCDYENGFFKTECECKRAYFFDRKKGVVTVKHE